MSSCLQIYRHSFIQHEKTLSGQTHENVVNPKREHKLNIPPPALDNLISLEILSG